MRDLQHTEDLTETQVIEHIMGAARANYERKERRTFGQYRVSFIPLLNHTYLASLRKDGVLVATAIIDQFDI